MESSADVGGVAVVGERDREVDWVMVGVEAYDDWILRERERDRQNGWFRTL